jgi:hypothetical protein
LAKLFNRDSHSHAPTPHVKFKPICKLNLMGISGWEEGFIPALLSLHTIELVPLNPQMISGWEEGFIPALRE